MINAKLFPLSCLLMLAMINTLLAVQQSPAQPKAKPAAKQTQNQSQVRSMSLPGLDNVFQIDKQIYSGSGPAEQKSFDALNKLGIKTIISVDGTKPHLDLAKSAGMRYVHIPIGYDGVSQDAGLAFARAARDLKGPIYIHCHHGRHRGPTAAAVVGLCRGTFDKKTAIDFLTQAGTSKGYAGLWKDVREFQIPSDKAVLPELVESTPVSPLVTAMSEISHHFEYLDQKKAANAQALIKKKNLEVLVLLREEFREASRKHAEDYDEMFKTWMQESEAEVRQLENAFQKNDQKQIAAGLKTLKSQCKQCHKAYRD